MLKFKKYMASILATAVFAVAGFGCQSKTDNDSKNTDGSSDKKIKVVASYYPVLQFVEKIGGDRIELESLVGDGVDPHDWEPTPQDIIRLQDADLFVVNGAGLEGWLSKVVDSVDGINYVEAAGGIKDLLASSGHHHHGHDDHDHDHDHDDHPSHENLTDADVAERPLSDFKAKWFGTTVLFKEGRLDEFKKLKAELDGKTEDEIVKDFTKGVAYDTYEITDKSITFTTIDDKKIKGDYDFDKYIIDDHGATFVYKLVSGDDKAPKFISIGDHMTGKEEDKTRGEKYHLHLVITDDEDKVMDGDSMVVAFEDVEGKKDHVAGLYVDFVHRLIEEAKEGDHDHDDHDHDDHDHDHDHDDHDHDHDHDDHDHDHGHGHEKLTDADVADRPLSDFKGGWFSTDIFFADGSLKEYVEIMAEHKGITQQAVIDEQTKDNDYNNMEINEKTITYTKKDGSKIEGQYDFDKYVINDHGAMFVYTLKSDSKEAPKFIIFSDHKTGKEDNKAEREKNDHMHVKYGDNLDEMLKAEVFPPFFIDSSDKNDIIEMYVKSAKRTAEAGHDDHDHDDDDHDHDHDDHDHDHDHDHGAFDPHTWLDPILAIEEAETIAKALIEVDPDGKAIYEKNLESFKKELKDLDKEYAERLKDVKSRVIVTSHQAFAYLAKRYNLEQKGIQTYISDVDPTLKEMEELIEYCKENNVKAIFSEALASQKIAKQLAEQADAEIFVLSPIETLTQDEIKNGDDYISVMKRNLDNLVEGLNR